MNLKEKAALAHRLVQEIIAEATSPAFRKLSEANDKIGGLIHSMSEEFISDTEVLDTWMNDDKVVVPEE